MWSKDQRMKRVFVCSEPAASVSTNRIVSCHTCRKASVSPECVSVFVCVCLSVPAVGLCVLSCRQLLSGQLSVSSGSVKQSRCRSVGAQGPGV